MKFLDPETGDRISYARALERARERYGRPFRSLTPAPRLEPESRDLIELNGASNPQPVIVIERKRA